MDKATFYTICKDEDRTVMVDEIPFPKEKRLGRRLDDRHHSALVTGWVIDKAGQLALKGSALWKDGRGVPTLFVERVIFSRTAGSSSSIDAMFPGPAPTRGFGT